MIIVEKLKELMERYIQNQEEIQNLRARRDDIHKQLERINDQLDEKADLSVNICCEIANLEGPFAEEMRDILLKENS